MRTRTIFTTVLAVAAVALTTPGAAPAAAQTPDPPDPILGLQYDLMNAGSVKLHGERPTTTGRSSATTSASPPAARSSPATRSTTCSPGPDPASATTRARSRSTRTRCSDTAGTMSRRDSTRASARASTTRSDATAASGPEPPTAERCTSPRACPSASRLGEHGPQQRANPTRGGRQVNGRPELKRGLMMQQRANPTRGGRQGPPRPFRRRNDDTRGKPAHRRRNARGGRRKSTRTTTKTGTHFRLIHANIACGSISLDWVYRPSALV